MVKRLFYIAILVFFAGQVSAEEKTYYSSYGDEYLLSTNADGIVLTSTYPKAWFVENGAASRIEKGIDVLYLGKSCDAFHKLFGKGRWAWGNGGFRIDFENIWFGFPRQGFVDENDGSCSN